MTNDTTQLTLSGTEAKPTYRDAEELRRLYHGEGLSLREISRRLGCDHTTVQHYMAELDIDRREITSPGPEPDGHAGFYTRRDGYEFWKSDSRVVLVHRLVMVAEEGVDAVKEKHVHHCNNIQFDNRPENLELLDPAEHKRVHHQPQLADGQLSLSEL